MTDNDKLVGELRFFCPKPGDSVWGFEPAGFGTIKLEHVPKSVRDLIEEAATALSSANERERLLREALGRYGCHDKDCRVRNACRPLSQIKCECGLDALIKAQGGE